MKCAGNEDTVTLKADEDPTSMTFIFENKKTDKVSEFILNLLTIDSEQLGIPETEYESIITMSSAEFTRICREMAQLSETINIETTKEAISFSVNGDIGSGSVKLKGNQSEKIDEATKLEVDEPVNLSFALRYLNLFNKSASLAPQVILSLSKETPLVVEYKVEKLGSVKYYLAPKITEDEE